MEPGIHRFPVTTVSDGGAGEQRPPYLPSPIGIIDPYGVMMPLMRNHYFSRDVQDG